MRKVYATMGESIYPNPSFLSKDFAEASGRLLRNHKEFTFQDMDITLAGIACIIMREVYATMGESIYPNPSFLSKDFPEASGRLLRNHKEFTFQDMAN